MGVYLIGAVVGGLIAGTIASSRGLSFGGYFVLGFLLPLIGIVIAAVARPAQRTQPAAGWWPDPMGRFEHRYFDGRSWTRFVGRGGQQFEDPV